MALAQFVLGAPRVVEPGQTYIDPFTPVEMSWTGPDGSRWNLTSGTSAVRVLAGLRGLHLPKWSLYSSEAPGLAGVRRRGSRATERDDVFWPVLVQADSSTDFLAIDSAWWRSLDPDREGVWEVQAGQSRRRLRLTLREASEVGNTDPVLAGAATYGVYLSAAQPFWEGDPISRSFSQADVQNYYAPPGSTYVHFVTAASSLDTASIDNPGDEVAWPQWVVTGPMSTVTLTVAGQALQVTAPLTAGQSLVIDSRPDRQTIVDQNGVDKVSSLGSVAWGSVPPGQSVPLGITATGAGSGFKVTASITPLYRRAW